MINDNHWTNRHRWIIHCCGAMENMVCAIQFSNNRIMLHQLMCLRTEYKSDFFLSNLKIAMLFKSGRFFLAHIDGIQWNYSKPNGFREKATKTNQKKSMMKKNRFGSTADHCWWTTQMRSLNLSLLSVVFV